MPLPLALAVTLSDASDMAACQWLLPLAVATGGATVHASRPGLPGSGQCMPAGAGREVTVARARAATGSATEQPKSPSTLGLLASLVCSQPQEHLGVEQN
jgi:hypothetical protein